MKRKHNCFVEQHSDGWLEFECEINPTNNYSIYVHKKDNVDNYFKEGLAVMDWYCLIRHEIVEQA